MTEEIVKPTEEEIIKAKTCIVYDDEEGFYTQASIEKVAQALASQRVQFEKRISELDNRLEESRDNRKLALEINDELHDEIKSPREAGKDAIKRIVYLEEHIKQYCGYGGKCNEE
jgi:hypothetical protein